jgi:uncharacterized protein
MDVRAARYQVCFASGPELLQGDLVVPAGPGPHPAVVIVGSSSGPRDRRAWVEQLALHGLATLTWDSPGWAEESSGYRRWQAPDERALEVLAAIDLLARIPEIAPGVGMIGSDTGCWTALLASALSRRVRAVGLLAPPCTGAMNQELCRLGPRLRGRWFIPAEVGLAQLVLGERIRRLAAGESAAAVWHAEAPCRHAPWYPWLPGTSEFEIGAFATLADYNPAALLRSVSCSVLGVFGTDDASTPAWPNAQALRAALTTSPAQDHDVVVVPHSDEAFTPPGSPGWDGPRLPGNWHHEVADLVGSWLAPRLARYRWTHAPEVGSSSTGEVRSLGSAPAVGQVVPTGQVASGLFTPVPRAG